MRLRDAYIMEGIEYIPSQVYRIHDSDPISTAASYSFSYSKKNLRLTCLTMPRLSASSFPVAN